MFNLKKINKIENLKSILLNKNFVNSSIQSSNNLNKYQKMKCNASSLVLISKNNFFLAKELEKDNREKYLKCSKSLNDLLIQEKKNQNQIQKQVFFSTFKKTNSMSSVSE